MTHHRTPWLLRTLIRVLRNHESHMARHAAHIASIILVLEGYEPEPLGPPTVRYGGLRHQWGRQVFDRDGGRCGICGELIEGALTEAGELRADAVHLDHIVPLALGGTHFPENLRPAHPLCNARRGTGRKSAS